MVEVDDCPRIDKEIEITTTWGFPESIDPDTVIFFGENDFALTLESDAKTKKPVLCKSLQQKVSVYNTLGSGLDADCLAKIERFYPKPDYREILVHERGNSKRNTQKTTKQVPGYTTKKNEKLGLGSTGGSNKRSDSISGESKHSTTSPRSDVSSTRPVSKNVPKPTTLPTSPVGTKRAPSSPTASHMKAPKQEPVDFPATTTYQDLGLTDHTGAYPCIYCGLTFMTMNELKTHCVEQHKTNKPFRCKFCVKCFRNSRQLLLHTFTHTGEKHYSCLYCPQMFRQPGHKNNHMRISHGDSFPYKCDQNKSRDQNMSRDQNKSCEEQEKCGAVFSTSLELTRHNKEKHVVRTTRCRACTVTFGNHTLYKEHQCPKKDRKLNCGACGEKFYRMADVLHHAKFCKYVDPTEVTCEKCGTTFPSAAKCSVHKTYLCTGEPIVPVKENKVGELLDKVKEEMVDYEEESIAPQVGVGTPLPQALSELEQPEIEAELKVVIVDDQS
ncbi:zinc finger protein 85-like [Bolinopsis microptera]|uniref:zinc finger protein 85-like n=1 Tax=Bolinopsis microptera TaxID=2820187 RepID=UPI003079F97F